MTSLPTTSFSLKAVWIINREIQPITFRPIIYAEKFAVHVTQKWKQRYQEDANKIKEIDSYNNFSPYDTPDLMVK